MELRFCRLVVERVDPNEDSRIYAKVMLQHMLRIS